MHKLGCCKSMYEFIMAGNCRSEIKRQHIHGDLLEWIDEIYICGKTGWNDHHKIKFCPFCGSEIHYDIYED